MKIFHIFLLVLVFFLFLEAGGIKNVKYGFCVKLKYFHFLYNYQGEKLDGFKDGIIDLNLYSSRPVDGNCGDVENIRFSFKVYYLKLPNN